jgi:hypothetical protein
MAAPFGLAAKPVPWRDVSTGDAAPDEAMPALKRRAAAASARRLNSRLPSLATAAALGDDADAESRDAGSMGEYWC